MTIRLLAACLFVLAAAGSLRAANIPPQELPAQEVQRKGVQLGKAYEAMTGPKLGDLVSATCARTGSAAFNCTFTYDPQVVDGQVVASALFTYKNVMTVSMSYLDGILGEDISELKLEHPRR